MVTGNSKHTVIVLEKFLNVILLIFFLLKKDTYDIVEEHIIYKAVLLFDFLQYFEEKCLRLWPVVL